MASVFDFAAHINARLGGADSFRINKLVYYVQAWSLVWRDRPAFSERIEAWKDGPVAKSLWVDIKYNGSGQLRSAAVLGSDDIALVDRVLLHYGHMSADQLIELTHSEDPWRVVRGDLPPRAISSDEIPTDLMRAYYAERWREARDDNDAIDGPAAFVGSVDDFAAFLQG